MNKCGVEKQNLHLVPRLLLMRENNGVFNVKFPVISCRILGYVRKMFRYFREACFSAFVEGHLCGE